LHPTSAPLYHTDIFLDRPTAVAIWNTLTKDYSDVVPAANKLSESAWSRQDGLQSILILSHIRYFFHLIRSSRVRHLHYSNRTTHLAGQMHTPLSFSRI
jgi:hypothetical protein